MLCNWQPMWTRWFHKLNSIQCKFGYWDALCQPFSLGQLLLYPILRPLTALFWWTLKHSLIEWWGSLTSLSLRCRRNLIIFVHFIIWVQIASHSPSNWTTLYNSDSDGLSLNRFEHHVMGYRGPTVSLLYAEGNRIFCLAVDLAWKASIQFWGSPNTVIVQLTPEYRVLDRKTIDSILNLALLSNQSLLSSSLS